MTLVTPCQRPRCRHGRIGTLERRVRLRRPAVPPRWCPRVGGATSQPGCAAGVPAPHRAGVEVPAGSGDRAQPLDGGRPGPRARGSRTGRGGGGVSQLRTRAAPRRWCTCARPARWLSRWSSASSRSRRLRSDLAATSCDQLRVELPRGETSPRDAVRLVTELAASLDIAPADPRVTGVGVAVPGLTRRADGFVHLAPNLGWKGVELGSHARRGSPPASRAGARGQRGRPGRARRAPPRCRARVRPPGVRVRGGRHRRGPDHRGATDAGRCRLRRGGRPHAGEPGRTAVHVRGLRLLGDRGRRGGSAARGGRPRGARRRRRHAGSSRG